MVWETEMNCPYSNLSVIDVRNGSGTAHVLQESECVTDDGYGICTYGSPIDL
ncbi:hypothetical protein DPMN_077768 [Dreissena polymorpha]|uniref:Uncharacterized protein n=1 Tax=Dreissena polymorpha TaxID=45954 RepID=A0A9D3YL27_DREPO|nr:hypothetical protein DPMN_077768 [Dreissena polymorpha]